MKDQLEIDIWNVLVSKMHDEGFDYCFVDYSSWEEVKDETFHILRQAYIKAAYELERYIYNKKIDNLIYMREKNSQGEIK